MLQDRGGSGRGRNTGLPAERGGSRQVTIHWGNGKIPLRNDSMVYRRRRLWSPGALPGGGSARQGLCGSQLICTTPVHTTIITSHSRERRSLLSYSFLLPCLVMLSINTKKEPLQTISRETHIHPWNRCLQRVQRPDDGLECVLAKYVQCKNAGRMMMHNIKRTCRRLSNCWPVVTPCAAESLCQLMHVGCDEAWDNCRFHLSL